MRKLVASFFISLDGVVEAPQNWHFPYFNDEMGAVVGEAIAASDAFLLGRRTY
jgi:RibD C-terminal domain